MASYWKSGYALSNSIKNSHPSPYMGVKNIKEIRKSFGVFTVKLLNTAVMFFRSTTSRSKVVHPCV